MITTTLEAVLFAIADPISKTKLQKNLNVSKEVLNEAIEALQTKFNTDDSGIHLLVHEDKVQFVTNKIVSDSVSKFLKKEAQGPLTRPSLETLTIIAYRGPITKPEIEQIRGVNCSLIIRNLLIRGFIVENQDSTQLQALYSLSFEFIRVLGLKNLEDLPDFSKLHDHSQINDLLNRLQEETEV